MTAQFSLKDKVVLLTGGAGLYGSGLSRDLAAAGAHVVIASRNRAAIDAVAAKIRADGHSASAVDFDQGSEESVTALRDGILKDFGRLDGLVNNAVARSMSGGSADLEGWRRSMDVNATGLYLMHEILGNAMGEGGSIVNIGSIYGMTGPTLSFYKGTGMASVSGVPDYFFNKGGMLNLTRFYAAQFGSKGIRVNCLSPGGFFNNQPELFVTRYCENTFLGRMGCDTDLGGPVVFLLSEASAYITGANIPVDGGFTAH